jgi:hypothetical protein
VNNHYLGQKDEEGKEVIEELGDGELMSKEDSQERGEEYEDEGPRQSSIRS